MSNLDKYTVEELDRENKELKANEFAHYALNIKMAAFISSAQHSTDDKDESERLRLFAIEMTNAIHDLRIDTSQSLANIWADAIEELIKEKAYSASIDGIATSIIDADDAIQYADKLRSNS